jgi:hypothetical protein
MCHIIRTFLRKHSSRRERRASVAGKHPRISYTLTCNKEIHSIRQNNITYASVSQSVRRASLVGRED